MNERLRSALGWIAIAFVLTAGLWVEIAPTLASGHNGSAGATCTRTAAEDTCSQMPPGVACADVGQRLIAPVRLSAVAAALGPLLIF
jgi:hypothetical protein